MLLVRRHIRGIVSTSRACLRSFSVLGTVLSHGSKTAVTDISGISHSYEQLNKYSKALALDLQRSHGPGISVIANFNSPGSNYIITTLAAWHLGAAIVPLCTSHTAAELQYFVEDSSSNVIVSTSDISGKLSGINVPVYEIQDRVGVPSSWDDEVSPAGCGSASDDAAALILYTSGTTGRPKGAVHTVAGVLAMVESLVSAWEYSGEDRILHFLPLHHLHGVLNKLLCMLYAGGHVEFMQSASAMSVWRRLYVEGCRLQSDPLVCNDDQNGNPVSLLMAVPTIYSKLLEAADLIRHPGASAAIGGDLLTTQELDVALTAVNNLRLVVSGSAAMPPPLMERWHYLAGGKGNLILERFGMTEIGMGLSNLYKGERVPGSVGFPLPGVSARLVDEEEREVHEPDCSGELRVKGAMVFREYLNKPEATVESFDSHGWFKTGDIARRDATGRYYILGRNSMDIIKSGGYKLSALEIERELLSNHEVVEAAVIGVEDSVYGQRVAAVITRKPCVSGIVTATDAEVVQRVMLFLNDRLASYKRPRKLVIVPEIPRNHMGKVNKKTLLSDLGLQGKM